MLSDWFNIYTGKHFIKKVYTLGHPKMQHLFPWIFHLWYPLEKVETVADFIFLGSKITADGDCRHEIKRHLLLGTKAMTSLLLLLSRISCVLLCATPQTAACQAPVPGILQARVLEWVSIAFSMTNLDSLLKSRDITLLT